MSTNVLTGPFLDFGSSFWTSSSSLTEFPGLSAKGFESTGKYGIGFFSTFMWGTRVRVTTRGYREAQRDTRVLEFRGGLSERPILRKASEDEYIRDGGTCVRVWLDKDPTSFDGLFHSTNAEEQQTPEEICAWLCPSLDVNLYFQKDNEPAYRIITAADWIDIDGLDFLKRVGGHRYVNRISRRKKKSVKEGELRRNQLLKVTNSLVHNLRVIKDPSGTVIGRVCISANDSPSDYDVSPAGVVTVGGFWTNDLSGISGLLVGTSQNAARDVGVPVVDPKSLAEWATEQADLVSSVYSDPELLEGCAATVRMCGGHTKNLPVAQGRSGWVSAEDIIAWPNIPDEILLVHDAALSLMRRRMNVSLYEHVLAVGMGWLGVLHIRITAHHIQWPEFVDNGLGFHSKSLEGTVIEALSNAWGRDLRDVVDASLFGSDDQDFERPIGTAGKEPLISRVDIIRKPL